MNALILATALLLQTPVSGTTAVSEATAEMMTDTIAAPRSVPALRAQEPAPALPIAPDKVQHFMMSYTIAVFTYGAARSIGVEREPALAGAMAGTLVAGVMKELIDARFGGDPSFGDLLADALGAAAAYALLSQVR